jgi:hypothetical protein
MAIKTYFPETSAVEELLNKGRIVFMSRLKIEKSVVLFEKWPLTKALKFNLDYGFESRTIKTK